MSLSCHHQAAASRERARAADAARPGDPWHFSAHSEGPHGLPSRHRPASAPRARRPG